MDYLFITDVLLPLGFTVFRANSIIDQWPNFSYYTASTFHLLFLDQSAFIFLLGRWIISSPRPASYRDALLCLLSHWMLLPLLIYFSIRASLQKPENMNAVNLFGYRCWIVVFFWFLVACLWAALRLSELKCWWRHSEFRKRVEHLREKIGYFMRRDEQIIRREQQFNNSMPNTESDELAQQEYADADELAWQEYTEPDGLAQQEYDYEYVSDDNDEEASDEGALLPCEIARLTRRIFSSTCPICIEDYKTEDEIIHLPNCYHDFHSECVTKWLSKNSYCPLCRENVRDALENAEN